jgi:hypothetical protein
MLNEIIMNKCASVAQEEAEILGKVKKGLLNKIKGKIDNKLSQWEANGVQVAAKEKAKRVEHANILDNLTSDDHQTIGAPKSVQFLSGAMNGAVTGLTHPINGRKYLKNIDSINNPSKYGVIAGSLASQGTTAGVLGTGAYLGGKAIKNALNKRNVVQDIAEDIIPEVIKKKKNYNKLIAGATVGALGTGAGAYMMNRDNK